MTAQNRIRIFDGNDELFCLILPIAVPIIAFLLWQTTKTHWYWLGIGFPLSGRYWGQFLADAVFLDSSHILFTHFFMLSLPEAKEWVVDRPKVNLFWITVVSCISILGLILLFKFGISILSTEFPGWHLRLWIFGFTMYYTLARHVLKQCQGLSLSYNRQLELLPISQTSRDHIKAAEKRERPLFQILIYLFGAGFFVRVFESAYPILAKTFIPIAVVMEIVAILLIANSFTYPLWKISNKGPYLIRLLLFPVGLILMIPLFVGYLFHGFEYFLTLKKMYRNSKASGAIARKLIPWLAPFAMLIVIRLIANPYNGLGLFFQNHFPQHKNLLTWLAAISITDGFIHSYLDSRIFRMKSPLARKHFGHLVIIDQIAKSRFSSERASGLDEVRLESHLANRISASSPTL